MEKNIRMSDDYSDYDDVEYEEENIETQEEYYDDDEYADDEYDDEEYYDEEEPYEDEEYYDEEEPYEEDYVDDYVQEDEDRLAAIMRELDELKQTRYNSHYHGEIDRLRDETIKNTLQNSITYNNSIFNEINKVKDDVSRNQADQRLQYEVLKLKSEMGRGGAGGGGMGAENLFLQSEINRLRDELSKMQQQAAMQAEIAKLKQELGGTTVGSASERRYQEEIAELRRELAKVSRSNSNGASRSSTLEEIERIKRQIAKIQAGDNSKLGFKNDEERARTLHQLNNQLDKLARKVREEEQRRVSKVEYGATSSYGNNNYGGDIFMEIAQLREDFNVAITAVNELKSQMLDNSAFNDTNIELMEVFNQKLDSLHHEIGKGAEDREILEAVLVELDDLKEALNNKNTSETNEQIASQISELSKRIEENAVLDSGGDLVKQLHTIKDEILEGSSRQLTDVYTSVDNQLQEVKEQIIDRMSFVSDAGIKDNGIDRIIEYMGTIKQEIATVIEDSAASTATIILDEINNAQSRDVERLGAELIERVEEIRLMFERQQVPQLTQSYQQGEENEVTAEMLSHINDTVEQLRHDMTDNSSVDVIARYAEQISNSVENLKLTGSTEIQSHEYADLVARINGIREELNAINREQMDALAQIIVNEINNLRSEMQGDQAGISSITAQLNQLRDEIKEHSDNSFGIIAENIESLRSQLTDTTQLTENADTILLAITDIKDEILQQLSNSDLDSIESDSLAQVLDEVNLLRQEVLTNQIAASQNTGAFSTDVIMDNINALRDEVSNALTVSTNSTVETTSALLDEITLLRGEIEKSDANTNHIMEELAALRSQLGATERQSLESVREDIIALKDQIQNTENIEMYIERVSDQISELKTRIERPILQPTTSGQPTEYAVILDEIALLRDELASNPKTVSEYNTELVIDEITRLRDTVENRQISTEIVEELQSLKAALSEQTLTVDMGAVLDEIEHVRQDLTRTYDAATLTQEVRTISERIQETGNTLDTQTVIQQINELRNDLATQRGMIDPNFVDAVNELKEVLQSQQLADDIRSLRKTISENGLQVSVDLSTVIDEINAIKQQIASGGGDDSHIVNELNEIKSMLNPYSSERLSFDISQLRQTIETYATTDLSEVTQQIKQLQMSMENSYFNNMNELLLQIREGLQSFKGDGYQEILAKVDEISEQVANSTRMFETENAKTIGDILQQLVIIREDINDQPTINNEDVLSQLSQLKEELSLRLVPDTFTVMDSLNEVKNDFSAQVAQLTKTIENRENALATNDSINELFAQIYDLRAHMETTLAQREQSQIDNITGQLNSIREELVGFAASGGDKEYIKEMLEQLSLVKDSVSYSIYRDNSFARDVTAKLNELSQQLATTDSQNAQTLGRQITMLRNDMVQRIQADATAFSAVAEALKNMRKEIEQSNANGKVTDTAEINAIIENVVEKELNAVKSLLNTSQDNTKALLNEINSVKQEIKRQQTNDQHNKDFAELRKDLNSLKSQISQLVNRQTIKIDDRAIISEINNIKKDLNNSTKVSATENRLLISELNKLKKELSDNISAKSSVAKREAAATKTKSTSQSDVSIIDLKSDLNAIKNIVEEPVKPQRKSETVKTDTEKQVSSTQKAVKEESIEEKIQKVAKQQNFELQESLSFSKKELDNSRFKGLVVTEQQIELAQRLAERVAQKMVVEKLYEKLGEISIQETVQETVTTEINENADFASSDEAVQTLAGQMLIEHLMKNNDENKD